MRTNTKGYLYMLGIEPEAANALLKELYTDIIDFTNDDTRAQQPTALRSRREIREERQAARTRADVRAERAELKRARRMPRDHVDGDWGVPCCSLEGATELLYQNHMVTSAHKRRKFQAAATSAAATAADAAPLPAETDNMSPAQTNKRRRDATSVAWASKRLRFVVSRTSVSSAYARGRHRSTARLDGLPASAKRIREDEIGEFRCTA